MAKKNSEALNRFKMEAANEVGVLKSSKTIKCCLMPLFTLFLLPDQ